MASLDVFEPLEELAELLVGNLTGTVNKTENSIPIATGTTMSPTTAKSMKANSQSLQGSVTVSALGVSIFLGLFLFLVFGLVLLAVVMRKKRKSKAQEETDEEAEKMTVSVSTHDDSPAPNPGDSQTTRFSAQGEATNFLPREVFNKVRFQNFDSRYKILEDDNSN